MIKNAQICMVPHPHDALMRQLGQPDEYLALMFEHVSSEGYPRGNSQLNMDYVEETLKDDLRAKFITSVEYLELLDMVKDYKREVGKHG